MSLTAVEKYEHAFCQATSLPTTYAFWKGRTALYAILKALDVGEGDEVIVPGFTCVVMPNAVRFVGAKPVYVDIAPNTYNLDPYSVRQRITPKTRALIVQHTFGIPAELDSLLDIARQHNLAVIEDCCHALLSTYAGQLLGTFGQAAFFSSQWTKPYTTGLGGMAVIADSSLAQKMRVVREDFSPPARKQLIQLRTQYTLYKRFFSPRLYWLAVSTLKRLSDWNLFVASSGEEELSGRVPRDFQWQMSDYQAKLGLVQLRKLASDTAHRERLQAFYEKMLQERGWPSVQSPKSAHTIYLRYPLCVANKSALLRQAEEARIELGSWFDSVLHPIKRGLDRFGYEAGTCPIAEQTAAEVINLPTHPRFSLGDAKRLVSFVCKYAEPSLHHSPNSQYYRRGTPRLSTAD